MHTEILKQAKEGKEKIMINLKKIFALTVAFSMVVGLTACGEKNDTTATSDSNYRAKGADGGMARGVRL